jgi:hypothetical protein
MKVKRIKRKMSNDKKYIILKKVKNKIDKSDMFGRAILRGLKFTDNNDCITILGLKKTGLISWALKNGVIKRVNQS